MCNYQGANICQGELHSDSSILEIEKLKKETEHKMKCTAILFDKILQPAVYLISKPESWLLLPQKTMDKGEACPKNLVI